MSTGPYKRRWFQFRLRTLLIVVAVLAVPLGWLANERSKVRARQEWLESREQGGSSIQYWKGPPAQPGWLRTLLGDDSPGDVQMLNLSNWPVTDAELVNIAGLTQVQLAAFSGPKVTDAGLVHLAGFTQLRLLYLSNTQVTDAGLEHLSSLIQLERLGLQDTAVTDAGLAHLANLSQLNELWLFDTKVTDAGLVHLHGLANLQSLHLRDSQTTPEGRQKLRQVLPKAKITPEP